MDTANDPPTSIADIERIIAGAVNSLTTQISEVSISLSDNIYSAVTVMENRMVDAENKITLLSERVTTIEGTIQSFSSQDLNFIYNNAYDCLSEIEPRFNKRKNVIYLVSPSKKTILICLVFKVNVCTCHNIIKIFYQLICS